MTQIRAVVRAGQLVIEKPLNYPEGTELLLQVADESDDDGPMSPAEIARILAAMRHLEPLEIPADVARDLEQWEQQINQTGIDRADEGIEDVFR